MGLRVWSLLLPCVLDISEKGQKMNMEHLLTLVLLGYSMGFGVSCCDLGIIATLCNGFYWSNKKKESSGRFNSNHSDERKRKLLAINVKVSSCDASVWGVNENQSKEKKTWVEGFYTVCVYVIRWTPVLSAAEPLMFLVAVPAVEQVLHTYMVNKILISAPFWLIPSHMCPIKRILEVPDILWAPRTSPRPPRIILSSYLISQMRPKH